MVFRFSAAVDRHRGWILPVAVLAGAAVVAGAVRSPTEPTGLLVATGVVAALALVIGAVVAVAFRWRIAPGFEVDEPVRAFRTPRAATLVFAALFGLATVTLFAGAGGWAWAHGDRDGGWLVLVLAMSVPALFLAVAAGRGADVTLTPDGVRARRGTGSLTIPWAALSADQPVPAAPQPDYRLDLALTDPDRVARRGLVRRRDRITFEGTQPAFAAAAIRHYAAHPADRPLIGTAAEHRRLVELLAVPPGPARPAPSRRRILVLAGLGITVFSISTVREVWIDGTIGRHGLPGYATTLLRQLLALLSLHFFVAAGRGVRARRRPAEADAATLPPQPPPQPPADEARPPSTPSPTWSRDVTGRS